MQRDLGPTDLARSVLLVTPSAANELSCADSGAGLAKCLGADLRRPVLMVDVAPEQPEASRRLGCDGWIGFTNLLLDETLKLEDLALATNSENLYFLPAGNASGRVPIESLPRFLELALDSFSFLVLLGGAVLENPTSLALASDVGLVLLFAVENKTLKKDVAKAQEALRRCKARKVGLVLTTTGGA